MTTIAHWINGKHHAAIGSKQQDIFNPATGAISGRVAFASAADMGVAVASAKAAFPVWSNLPPLRRARILNKFLALLNEQRDELARMHHHR